MGQKPPEGKELWVLLIYTAKLPRGLVRWGGMLAGLVLCAGALLPCVSVLMPAVEEASAQVRPGEKGVRTNEDRVAYLSAWGWEVSPEPVATEELLIPEEMNESYQQYLTLQEEQGFDLSQHAGKRVKRYTYEVYNYPTGESGVQANLLIRKGTVVGGEILSPRLDGFIHGLSMPQRNTG